MKRLCLTLSAALIACCSMNAKPWHFGLKGGINTSEIDFSSKQFASENGEGFFFGPILHTNLPLTGVGFNIAGLYNQQDTKVNGNSLTMKSLDIPLNMRLAIRFGSLASVYVEGGPQLAVALGDCSFEFTDTTHGDVRWKRNETDFSLNLGAGITLWRLQVGVNYNIPFDDSGTMSWRDASNHKSKASSKSSHWQLSAALYF
ncbi:MAG: porin family protein [Bacteroidaceae bacterium]|nr:porin family protein [Bacteroidaceae bacterium]